ncbi:LacI family DNA-binding transcriptional regulator [Herbiconiux sp. A18JL235]|uniref:LacI family DNA-binding transcriptional regulator n=1 Tax=Herbiconiux sp. A18JL235 TaxID=3152363 RepID=A0AB39BFD4_9MICO
MATTPTLKDVAQRAGVSMTTASHTFSGRRPVSPATRAAVLEAAFELGFSVRRRDRPLNVGLLLRPVEAVSGFVTGTGSFSSFAGTMLLSLLTEGFSVTSFRDLSEVGHQVAAFDAFVLLGPNRNDKVLHTLIERDIPTVTFDPDPGEEDFHWWAGPDYSRGVRHLIAHLIEAGARQPALIVGATPNTYLGVVRDAYIDEMRIRGLRVLVRELNSTTAQQGGYAAARSLMGVDRAPDAVITSSPVFAVGALDGITAAGRTVPDDVLLASMADAPIAERARVGITAVRPDWHATSRVLTALLVRRLTPGATMQHGELLGLEIVRRASTRRAPA